MIQGGVAALAMTPLMAAPVQATSPAPGADSPARIEGVVVTAMRPKARVLLDRKVYTVTGDLLRTAGAAADILNQIPSVDVDADGNVSLRGDTHVTILVDGKPSAQFSGATLGVSLQQFPAADIDRIEVMTNPPAQYKAEGAAGVINIITRKSHKAGLAAAANASVGDKRRFVVGLNVTDTLGRLKLSGGVTLRQDARDRRISDTRAAADPGSGALVLSQETFNEHLRRLIPLVKVGADYQFNDRQLAGVSYSHRELSGDRYFTQIDQSAGETGPVTALTDRFSLGHEWSADNGETVHFDQGLWRPGESLSLDLRRSVTRERERYAYVDDHTLPAIAPTQDSLRLSLDLVTVEFSADYTLPMAKGRSLQVGFDHEDNNNQFDNVGAAIDGSTGQATNEPGVTNHFRFHQEIDSAYGQFRTPIGPWTAQGGLRLEQTDVQTLQITGSVPGAYGYFRAYPSLNLERALSNSGKLSFSASRRITRPDPEALNPFTDYQDVYNLRAGNAKLLPQDTWSYEAGYTDTVLAQSWGLTAYYQFNRDSVTDLTKVVSSDVVLVTKQNLPKSKAAGLEFSAKGKLAPRLSYGLSGNMFYSQIDATALGASGLKSTIGLNTKASFDWKPTGADTLQVSFSRTDKRLTPQGSVGAINLVNLGLKHQLSPDLSAVITVSDVFNGQRLRRLVTTTGLNDDFLRYQVGRVAYVGLVYTLGAPRKAKTSGFDYDQP